MFSSERFQHMARFPESPRGIPSRLTRCQETRQDISLEDRR